jgi:hypothetical protein
VRVVDPEVMRSMRLMEEATLEYQTLEQGRTSLQLAFGILYLGFALIVLLAAIWTAIAVADRLVRPIRVLIGASDDVASGNLDVGAGARLRRRCRFAGPDLQQYDRANPHPARRDPLGQGPDRRSPPLYRSGPCRACRPVSSASITMAR